MELIKLLGHTKNYEKINIKDLKNFLDNDKTIKELLTQVDDDKFKKLKEILSLEDSEKDSIYDYIKSNLIKIEMDNSNNNEVEYKELSKESFIIERENYYIAKNVLFNNLKVREFEIFDTLENGLETLNKIKQQYLNINLKELCTDLIVKTCAD